MKDYIYLKNLNGISKIEGRYVAFTGVKSEIPWQHLINHKPDYPELSYVDVEGDQVVIYSKARITCLKYIKIFGKVIRIQGRSKRPGSEKKYTEYQVVADKWECLNTLEK